MVQSQHGSDTPSDDFLSSIGDVLAGAQDEAVRAGRAQIELVDVILAIVTRPWVTEALEELGKAPDLRPFRGEPTPVWPWADQPEGTVTTRVVLEGGELGASAALRTLLDRLSRREPKPTRTEALCDIVDEAVVRDQTALPALTRMRLQPEEIKEAIRRAAPSIVPERSGPPGDRRRRPSRLDMLLAMAEPMLLRAQWQAMRSGRGEIGLLDLAVGIATDPGVAMTLKREAKAPAPEPTAGGPATIPSWAVRAHGLTPDGAEAGKPAEAIRMSHPVRELVQEFSAEVGEPMPDLLPWMYLNFLQRAVESDPAVPAVLAGMNLDSETVSQAIRRFYRLPI